jgi:lysozyme
MQTSANGIAFLISNEGRINKAYHIKGEQYWTIGVGHYGADVVPNSTITDAQVDALLKKDLRKYEASVNQWIKAPLNQNQFDALVDFAHNEGVGALNPTQNTFARLINQGKYTEGANHFTDWSASQSGLSLRGRRLKEKALFNKAVAKAPVKNTNNQQAVEKADAQKKANDKKQKAIEDQLRKQDIRDELDDNKAIQKAKLSNDAQKLKIAQAKAKANKIARENAKKIEDANKLRKSNADKKAKENAYKSNNPQKNSISQPKDSQNKSLPKTTAGTPKILRSGFSILGLVLIATVMYNVEIPETTIE